ncbi:MAG: YceD family protein [Solirubrobacterales bacterium]
MSQEGTNTSRRIDLGRQALDHGQGRRLEVELHPATVHLGGQRYGPTEEKSEARVDVSRTSGGWALHLTFAATLSGPCVRCLEPAQFAIEVDAREVEEPEAGDEELRSPYFDGLEVDIERWVNDSLLLEMPLQPLCRPDCAGLCPVCGASLNDADPADHEHGGRRDPRWAKLDELKGN